jgi:hypothetical protein
VSEDDDDPVRSVEVVSDEDDEEVAEPVESGLEPELMVSEPDVPGRLELAPEPAPEPMLPEVVSPLGEVDERLLSRFDLVDLSDHFVNSDCDSEPSLLESAVLNAPLSSACIAASVCEMRPSRFASSEVNDAVPELWLAALLLLCPAVLLWLVLLCAYAVAAITAAATALITADFFMMVSPRELMVISTAPCWTGCPPRRDVEKLRQPARASGRRGAARCVRAPNRVPAMRRRNALEGEITFPVQGLATAFGRLAAIGPQSGEPWRHDRIAGISRRLPRSYRALRRAPTLHARERIATWRGSRSDGQGLESRPFSIRSGDCSA